MQDECSCGPSATPMDDVPSDALPAASPDSGGSRRGVGVWGDLWCPKYICAVYLLGLLAFPNAVAAQQKTIPEQLAQAGRDLRNGATIPSGRAPDIDEVLQETDLIVRGIVGEPKSYLSDNQLTVFSDYPIEKAGVLFDTLVISTPTPGFPKIVVTIEGGTVVVGGLKYILSPGALAPLHPSSEVLLLLRRVKDRLQIAGFGYLGVFQIEQNTLVPLTGVRTFATEYRGMETSTAINSVVSRRQSIVK